MNKRNLNAFQQQEASFITPAAIVKRRHRLAALVASPTYEDLKALAEGIVTPQAAAIPNSNGGIAGVIGYFSFSIVRDVLSQLFDAVEKEAQLAQQEELPL